MRKTKEEFFKNVDALNYSIFSKTGKRYFNLCRDRNFCKGTRESGTSFILKLDALYQAYQECDTINTAILKDKGYIKGWKRSPALAILRATGLVGEDGKTMK